MNNSFRKIYTIESSLGSSKPLPRQRRENLLDFFQLDETEIASLKPREHEKKKTVVQLNNRHLQPKKKERRKKRSTPLLSLNVYTDRWTSG